MSTNRCKKVRSIIAMLLAVVMMTGMLPTRLHLLRGRRLLVWTTSAMR